MGAQVSEFVGPYRIERELGRGGMGVVYAGVHRELGRRAAVKVLLDPKIGKDRFEREGEGMARLTHPGIVRTYEAGVHEGRPFLAMELVEGRSLKEVLATSGPWPSREAAELGLALSEAMAHVHAQGLLHRDLKPENILIDATGHARITDFGLVRGVGTDSLTATGTMVGTPSFMPPEQAEGEKRQLGPPADVYGLGATIFAVLTGRPPFEGPSPYAIVNQVFNSPAPRPSSLQEGVDPALEEVILRCLSKGPEARYPNAQALAEVFQRYLAGELEGTPTSGRSPLVFVLGALVVLGLGLGGLVAWRASTPTQVAPQGPDPKEVRAAWREARGDAGLLARWLESYGEHAEADLVKQARETLAKLTWRELPEIGSTEDDPPLNDLARLTRYQRLAAWLRDPGRFARGRDREEIEGRLRLWREGGAPPVLARFQLRALPGGSTQRDRRPFSLKDGRLLSLGLHPALEVWDPTQLGPTREVPMPSDTPTRPVPAALERGGELLVAVDDQLIRLDSASLETRGRVSIGPLRARGILALPEGVTLVLGELPGEAEGGGWTLIPPKWPEEAQLAHKQAAAVRAGLFDAERSEVYLAGGSSKPEDDDFYLWRYRWGGGKLELLDEVKLTSAGYHIADLPDGRILVGLNRSSAVIFERGNLKGQPLTLNLSQSQSAINDLGTQCLGSLPLPGGGLLIGCDPYQSEEKNGWLGIFDAEQLASAPGASLEPKWIAPLGSRPLTLTESPDGSLIYLGTHDGYLSVLPRFALR